MIPNNTTQLMIRNCMQLYKHCATSTGAITCCLKSVEIEAADALSRRVSLSSIMSIKDIFLDVQSGRSDTVDSFRLEKSYQFRANKLCIPRTSMWDFIVWEIYAGGLVSYFGRDKTIEEVERQFYWPSSKKDVAKIVSTCNTCQLVKQKRQNTVLYTPLPVSNCSLQDISMDL
ncbi:uncharacterized protein LOC111377680, partial [Olea europaea var. sylvestris]|uniref:uncharacterized protein LOC111377680 n=1 Tax=Olea europaea var. sylvestris TaxID=158386 RepID=UPI000C1D8A0E